MHIRAALLGHLSLDAPIIGVLWLNLFSKLHDMPISNTIVWLLFSTIWVTYAVDRLTERESEQMRERHNFHQNHSRIFWVSIIGVLLCNIFLIWKQPLMPRIMMGGFVLSGFSVLYLLFPLVLKNSNKREWIKNIHVSITFALGTTLPFWTQFADPRLYLEIMALSLLAFSNLRLMGAMEEGNPSFPHEVLLCGGLILTATVLHPGWIMGTWVLSYLLMLLIWLTRKYHNSPSFYDISLILPAFFMLFITP